MIQRIRTEQDSKKQPDIGTLIPTNIGTQSNNKLAPTLIDTQETGQVHQTPKAEQNEKCNHRYRSKAQRLIEALDCNSKNYIIF